MIELALLTAFCATSPASQDPPAPDLPAAILGLASRDRKAQEAAIDALGRLRDGRAIPALTALRLGLLYTLPVEGGSPRVVIVTSEKERKEFRSDGSEWVPVTDAVTGAPLEGLRDVASLSRVVATNSLKLKIAPVLSRLSLASPDVEARRLAALRMGTDANPESMPFLEEALKVEGERRVRRALEEAIDLIRLADADAATRRGAAERLGERGGMDVLGPIRARLEAGIEPDAAVQAALQGAVRRLEERQSYAQTASTVFEVLSLSSILMIVALGLAITFGVMGVINMAHGEMLMLGAYATYVVQNVFARSFPGAYGAYFVLALPVSFAVAGGLGLVVERLLLRHLYGRPLESMLATWGVSLILQQAVRTIFGAANVDIRSPGWLSGGFEPASGFVLGYNRLFILVFSLACLLGLYLLLWRSPFGLRIRAVMQNRSMAACLGVATPRVDALTFALGAGVAGMAGCAMSQLGTVGPGLGQTYIVDAFMVVVLGGVGKLAGTLVAAFGMGGVNKILETIIGGSLPKWGPILSKVAVLVLLILFLQKKPSGLFAVRGRHADA
ncbi:MAG TPA: urea ABC transporter permease subunit UrtB [Planctomycetota bacterium]